MKYHINCKLYEVIHILKTTILFHGCPLYRWGYSPAMLHKADDNSDETIAALEVGNSRFKRYYIYYVSASRAQIMHVLFRAYVAICNMSSYDRLL